MEDLPISFLDIVILVTIGLSAIVGMVRGFVREVLALASWIGAGWVTLTFYPDALDYLQTMIETEVWAKVAAGGGLFILSLVVFTIIARLVAGTVQNSKLIGPLDRTMGLAFGVLRGALLLTLANIFVLKMVADDSERPDWVAESNLYPYVESSTATVLEMFPNGIKLPSLPSSSGDSGKTDADTKDEFGYTPDDDIGRLIEQELKDQLAPEKE